MGWLTKLPFGKGGTAVAEAEREDADSMSYATSGPPLMVLVNDASGRASFKTHVFDDAASATEWVRYWFPLEAEHGLTAFWAMTERPEGGRESGAEPLVMIRDTSRDGVVYLFSFVDIDSAQTFLREEVERGTKLNTMLLYWAVQVKREIDRWGKVTLTPSTPPGVAAYEPQDEIAKSDGWVVPEAPAAERAPAKPVGNAQALMVEAPNARTGVAEPNGPGEETFELTSWMERARKSSSRQRDVVEAAAEVVAASEESFEEAAAIEAEPEAVFEDAVAVEPTVEAEAEAVVEAAAVEAPEAAEPEVIVEAVVVAEAPEISEPEMDVEAVVTAEAREASAPEVVVEAPVVGEASEDTEIHALTEAVSEAEVTEVDDRARRARASTNGNGHKSPRAHEVVIEINGHKSNHEALAEPVDSGSPVANGPRPSVHEETLPSMNGNAAANGQATKVTSQNGEGTPAVERPVDRSDVETGELADEAPEIVHDVRVEAAANGRLDEKISIQIGIHLQSRALKVKRWEVKDEPFGGFKSPPGRF